MCLLPVNLTIPQLYGQDGMKDEAIVYAKLFTPDSNWTWYVTEYDPIDRVCFGLVVGFVPELGYFSIDELEEVTGPMGLHIERDLYFEPQPLKNVRKDW